MSAVLPPIRFNLDVLPSSDPRQPGLLLRDPYHYSDATLLIPPLLVSALNCFDGVQSTVDLRAELVRATGELQIGPIEKNLYESLDQSGFLENDTYWQMKASREQEFARETEREAIFAGSAYPEQPDALRNLLARNIGSATGSHRTMAIAAPHASPDGGWTTYRAAYQAMPTPEAARDMTFVILGTSHYGAPEHFGLTRKPYVTPFGASRTNVDWVNDLVARAPNAVRMEDYCHAVEHSIEFQIVFLQHLYGADVSVLPILCGPFVKSLYQGGWPEADDKVQSFIEALGHLHVREGKRLFWVLGVDMAHIGLRYGDPAPVIAHQGQMLEIKERDTQRISTIETGRLEEYWSAVQTNQDDLKWCGAAPFYTFMKAVPEARGQLLHYDQWQIDEASVVSFGAMKFERAED